MVDRQAFDIQGLDDVLERVEAFRALSTIPAMIPLSTVAA